MSDSVVIQTACRLCGQSLVQQDPVLDLGVLQVSQFVNPQNAQRFIAAPLALAECQYCRLVQLTHTVHPRHLFGDYWYASGINGTMREELRNVVREARMWVQVHDGDWVLDIGANDGTLLSAWREHLWEGKPYRFAVEPSPTFAKPLADVAEAILTESFPAAAMEGATKFRVITSIAMFYAVQDPVAFALKVADLLTDDGVWIVQMQDLHSMVARTAFDNICHEHLTYYSVATFEDVCQRAGLQVVSVQPREINGGSLRFVVKKRLRGVGYQYSPVGVAEPNVDWPAFQQRIDDRVDRLKTTIAAAQDHGHMVDLLGASTKGNTLLQVAGIGPAQIRQCWERHPGKIGRVTITGISIVHESDGRSTPPGLLVCPIWQFREALIERESEYLQQGGRIYFPLPDGDLFQYRQRELQ